jgi:flagellar hook-basal body complex protein FliE
MSDPIGAAGLGGRISGLEGGDGPKRYTVDLGKDGTNGSSFGDSLTKAINQVSDAQDDARSQMDAFIRGEPIEMHRVMASAEQAGIALDLMVEVRNKVLDAYRTLINMQS